ENKWSGQIPAFGNWDYANELPITQYFESARQAGLLRFSNSSGEGDLYMPTNDPSSLDLNKPLPRKASSLSLPLSLPSKARVGERKYGHVKEQRKQGRKVCDEMDPPRKHAYIQNQKNQDDAVSPPHHPAVVVVGAAPPPKPKPVDEDLYKIPPDLLYSSKRVQEESRVLFEMLGAVRGVTSQ
ncbi:hypothetical protein RJ641_023365, partial [Dillenia turbinata]